MTPSSSEAETIRSSASTVLVRADAETFAALESILYARYPNEESGAIVRFGWRETPGGLVLTLAEVFSPLPGEMDDSVPNVRFLERYLLRAAVSADDHPLGIGVVHSHPEGANTSPSWIDDQMDGYLSRYFAGFAPGRPYASLIFARSEVSAAGSECRTSGTGRVHYAGSWHEVERFCVEGRRVSIGRYVFPTYLDPSARRQVARLSSAFGIEAAERLHGATIGIVGSGGTGSPAIEVLARAGVGRLIVVDPDAFEDSNLERVHGSREGDLLHPGPKAAIALRHISEIRPDCEVIAIQGSLPQREVIDALVRADAVIGCVDAHAGRLALSDLAFRYLVPVMDCSVALEGANGGVTGQVSRFVRFRPTDPCALCQRLIDPQRVAQELMSPSEQVRRREIAAAAASRGADGRAYWTEVPQLNTVGYLTAATGAMAAGYVIGAITQRFQAPFRRLEMNWVAELLQVVDATFVARPTCACRQLRGWADQGASQSLVGAPDWWSPPVRLNMEGAAPSHRAGAV